MAERKGKGILLAGLIWMVILLILAVAAKFFILPYFQQDLETKTGSESRYKTEIKIAADSFSGYCILRSPVFSEDLSKQGIKLTIQDDQADYASRMNQLKKKKIQMAVFTVDSFVTAGAKLGSFPGTIVMVIDETKGADAMLSYKEAVGSIDDLDHPDARIVLTPQSPSEFLARTVIAHFNLPNLPATWWLEADGSEDVYRKFIAAKPSARRAYVLWEPWVTKALEVPGTHLLLDSSKLKGYIVDVLVVEREFLRDQPGLVQQVVEAYFRAAYHYGHKHQGLRELVQQDAKFVGSEELSLEVAGKLVAGIEWKNTLENYAHFGLLPAQDRAGLYHLEDIVRNITEVLVKTGTIENDPLQGEAHKIFYDKALRALQVAQFHPGKKLNLMEGVGPGNEDLEKVRMEAALSPLTDQEWDRLVPVGQMRVKPIAFARGTARINLQSQRELEELARKLGAMPHFYLMVVGHARQEGDPEANRKLAKDRAQSAADQLMAHGVDSVRIRVRAATPRGADGDSQSVSFVLGQKPY